MTKDMELATTIYHERAQRLVVIRTPLAGSLSGRICVTTGGSMMKSRQFHSLEIGYNITF